MSASSPSSLRAGVCALESIAASGIHVSKLTNMKATATLLSALETVCGSRYYYQAGLLRSLALSRDQEAMFAETVALENEIVDSTLSLRALEQFLSENDDFEINWILLARALLAGAWSDEGRRSRRSMNF